MKPRLHIPDGRVLNRRSLIAMFGGAVIAMPLTVRAQPKAMPVIGFVGSTAPGPFVPFVAAFRKGLGETGFVEGQNVTIEYRWADGHFECLPALAADLVRRNVDVIAASGGIPTALAAKNATSTIPIVFEMGADPV